MNIKDFERLIVENRALRQKVEQLAGMRQAQGATFSNQRLMPALVVQVNAGSPATYHVRPLAGPSRKATEWLVSYCMSVSSSTSFSVGDFVMLLLSEQGNNYIFAGGSGSGGGGDTYVIPTGWPVQGA